MARTRKLPTNSPDDSPTVLAGDSPDRDSDGPTSRVLPGDDVAPGETRTTRLFAEMIPTDFVRILRDNDVTKARVFHGALSYEQATPEYLTSLFGGGLYRLQLIRRGKNGGDVIHRNMSLEIPGAYRPPVGPLPGTVAVTGTDVGDAAETKPGAMQSGMSPREMLDYAALSRLMEVMKQAPAQPTTTFASLAPILTPLIAGGFALATTLLTREKKPDDALTRQLEELRGELRKMQDRPGPAAAGMDELLGLFDKMQGLRKAVTGEGGEQGGDGGMWKDVLKMGLDMLQRGQQAPGAPQPAQLGAGEQPPAAVTDGSGVPFPPWHQMLQEYRGMLVDAAQKNRNPGVAAGIVAEYCPDNYRGTLVELAQATNTETLLVQAVPELQHFPTWVTEFVEEVRANLFGDGGDDDDDEKPETTTK